MAKPVRSLPAVSDADRAGRRDVTGLRCRWESSPAAGVLHLDGRLGLDTSATVRVALHKGLVDHPAAIVVDLGGVTVDDDIALLVFAAFARSAAGWPGCPVLLCAPSEVVRAGLSRLAINPTVPVYPDLAAALAVAAALPVPLRYVQPLPGSAAACALARDLVGTACRQWRLPQLAHDASLVVTELVSNAVRHAGGASVLQVTLRDRFLHLSVHDGSPVAPRPTLLDPDNDTGGRGLLLIDAVSAGWGSTPTGSGKTVWATLRIRP